MKKHNTLLVRIGFLAVVVIIVLGTTIYGQGTLNEAKKLMDDGQSACRKLYSRLWSKKTAGKPTLGTGTESAA